MVSYQWNPDKDREISGNPHRGVSFEEIVTAINNGGLLDNIGHPRPDVFPNQRVLVLLVKEYVYAVPFVRDRDGYFLKTVYPSRKLTARYLRETKS